MTELRIEIYGHGLNLYIVSSSLWTHRLSAAHYL